MKVEMSFQQLNKAEEVLSAEITRLKAQAARELSKDYRNGILERVRHLEGAVEAMHKAAVA